MQAITIVPGATQLNLVQRAEPSIQQPDEVLLEVVAVGICGTDREEAAGGRAQLPQGQTDLVMGHEMLGRVVATGSAVTRVQTGDLAVFTVRRGCGQCLNCRMQRPDMCRTGNYRERGIWGLDGYQAERVVDQEEFVVRVPAALGLTGVLAEPTSVVEKAIHEALRVQLVRLPDAPAHLDWLYGRRCLVAGLGPVGLLAAMVLRLHGAVVYGLDIVDAGSARPRWLEQIGGLYVDGRGTHPDQIAKKEGGAMDLIIDAAGIPSLVFNLLDALAPTGVYALTGIPGGNGTLEISGAELLRRLVLNNQLMVGSVNAARDHFQLAVDDLHRAHLLWGGLPGQLITHRYPVADFQAALTTHPADEIKTVIEWKPL